MAELLAGLAAYRAARLAISDAITEKPRGWLDDRTIRNDFLFDLLHCGYCLSVWFAFAFTARRRGWLRAGLAASGVAAGMWTLERIVEELEHIGEVQETRSLSA